MSRSSLFHHPLRGRRAGVAVPAAVALITVSIIAEADESPPPPPAAPSVLWKDGFQVQTADGSYRLHIGGVVQADGRYFPGNTTAGPIDQFAIRRARIEVEGTVGRYVNLRVLPDFAGGQIRLFDAWAELAVFPWLELRAGKFKVPFSLERLQSASNLIFLERGYTTLLSPHRDIGAMLHGDVLDGTLLYAVGVFNGNGDNSTGDVPFNGDQDIAGRLFFHPFRKTGRRWLHPLGIGGAFTWGQARGAAATPNLPSDSTDGRNVFFRYKAGASSDDTAIAAGHRIRATGGAYFYWNRLGLLGDYVWNSQEVRFTVTRAAVVRQAWQVYASFLLTPDQATYNGVKPARPFNIIGADKGSGAWEIAFRYSGIAVDRTAFDDGFADITKVPQSATSYAAGLNWYLNGNAKVQLDYVHTGFSGGASGATLGADGSVTGGNRASEEALLGRFQWAL